MKDKDTDLIYEAYNEGRPDVRYPEGDQEPDPGTIDKLPSEVNSHDVKFKVAAEVKQRFEIDVEWHDKLGEGSGEWHRSDIHSLAGQESRPVTDDELEKIMIIEDPERALERWPSLRKHPELFNSAFGDDKAGEEETFPPENGRRY